MRSEKAHLNQHNVTYTDHENIISVRVVYKHKTVRIIVAYGLQEKEELERRKEFFTKLGIEIERTMHAGEGVLIIGDLNAKLEQNDDKITPLSGNGVLLLELIEDMHLNVINFSPLCQGKWTYSKEVKGEKIRSRLDYLLVSEDFTKSVRGMEIDEEKSMCPFHITKEMGETKMIYSDHNPLIVDLELIPTKTKVVKEEKWIITKPGLEKFHSLTGEFKCSDNTYKTFESSLLNVMKKCFRREWRKRTDEMCCSKQQREILKLLLAFKKKGKIQRLITNKYITKVHMHMAEKISHSKRMKVESTVQRLTVGGKFSSNEFYKLTKELCPKSKSENLSVILENGDEVQGEQAIKDAYRCEFENRLKHNKIHDDYLLYEEKTNELCELYMKIAGSVQSPDFEFDEVKTVVKSLKDKKAAKIPNEIYKHGGDGLVREMTNVLNWIKQHATTPKEWNEVMITPLFKNKGSKKKLVYYRGIFLTDSFSKILEKLIKMRHNANLKAISSSQNGATEGKCPADNIFILNACIDHSKYLNKALYLCFYDMEQCFDKLWLEDCIVSLWNAGVRDDLLPLILSLNEESNITVKAPGGKAQPFKAKRIVKQGTVLGPQLCKVSTAEYGDDTPGFQLGEINIKPPIFVDDILTIAGNAADSKKSHQKAISFQYRKRCKFGKTKCEMIVVNEKKLDIAPVLEIDGHVMKKVDKAKYVGDFVNHKGTNSDLIAHRVRNGNGKIISILAMCEESGLGRYTLQSSLLLYNAVFVQGLIFNCQGWSHITQENFTLLQTLQLKFLKLALWLPLSTSNIFIFLELGILPISHEIQRRRLVYLHKILNLPDDDPILQTYKEGLKFIY